MSSFGVVLGGGGVLCAAELGVLRALAEWGVVPEVVVGTSGGGIIAGALAAGMPLEGIIVFLRGVCLFPERYLLHEAEDLWADIMLRPEEAPGVLTLRPMLQELDKHCATHEVMWWKPGYGVVASDVAARRPLRIGRDLSMRTSDALQATSAFPGLFQGVRIGDSWLVDGGLLNNVPADYARDLGATSILAVDLGGAALAIPPTMSLFGALWRCVDVAVAAAQRPEGTPAPLRLRPSLPAGAWLLSFGLFDSLLQAGYQAAVGMRTEIEALAGG
jgi:NTE family protein